MDYDKISENLEVIEDSSTIIASNSNEELYEIKEFAKEDVDYEIEVSSTPEDESEQHEIEEKSTEDGEIVENIEVVDINESEKNPAVNAYLNSDFGSHQEQDIKKMMAAAAIASGADYTPEEIATQADTAAVNIKTAYKVSAGQLDVTESTEVLIDYAAARANTFIQKKLNLSKLGESLLDVASFAYPPVRLFKPYVAAVIKKVEPVVRKAITVGIKKVANYAKKTVKSISQRIKNLAKRVLA